MGVPKILPWSGRRRSTWKKDVLWLAGATGAGIAVGALLGGKKGASIGAVSGSMGRWIWKIAGK
jgi:hypothetical protein